MLFNLPPELLSSILGFLDLLSLKNCSDSCRTLRDICSDPVLNPWRHAVRCAIHELFTDDLTREKSQPHRELIVYPTEASLTFHESQTLSVLAALGTFASVPRSVLVDVLALSPPRFLLYHSTRSNLPRELWEEAFRRRFLPSWAPSNDWIRTLQHPSWSLKEGFFRLVAVSMQGQSVLNGIYSTIHSLLEQINHRLTSNCTSLESWTDYMVILRSGIAATCTAYSRTFSAPAIMQDLK
jgi:hypothetical protein